MADSRRSLRLRLRQQKQRERRRRLRRQQAAHGRGGGGGSAASGGDSGGGGTPPPPGRAFEVELTRGGQSFLMTEKTASARVTTLDKTGTWDRYREDLGGFDFVLYLRRSARGAVYIMTNGFGTDDGGDAGYFDKLEVSVDNQPADVIIPEMPALDVNILPQTLCHTGTIQSFDFISDAAQPDTRSWLDSEAQGEIGTNFTSIGPYTFYPNDDQGGDAGGGQEVGSYPEWMRASPNAMNLALERAEASSMRHRVGYLQAATGNPRFINRSYSQVRNVTELFFNTFSDGAKWSYETTQEPYASTIPDGVPPDYRALPDGSCSYEQTLLNWGFSFDGQHQRRHLYYWDVLKNYDPRWADFGSRDANDCRMAYNFLDNGYSNNGLDIGNPEFMDIQGLKDWMALNPGNRGAPNRGSGQMGRAFSHAVRILSVHGNAGDRANLRSYIREYTRIDDTDPEVDTDSLGTAIFTEGSTSQPTPERDDFPTTLGATASPPYPPALYAREPQFTAMNYPLLGDMQDLYDLYVNTIEPWPLKAYQSANPLLGTTGVLSIWYSLAFGFYHDTSGPHSGQYVDAAAVYADGVSNPVTLRSNILSQCPTSMWDQAV